MRRFVAALLLGALLTVMVANAALAGARPWVPDVEVSSGTTKFKEK